MLMRLSADSLSHVIRINGVVDEAGLESLLPACVSGKMRIAKWHSRRGQFLHTPHADRTVVPLRSLWIAAPAPTPTQGLKQPCADIQEKRKSRERRPPRRQSPPPSMATNNPVTSAALVQWRPLHAIFDAWLMAPSRAHESAL